MSVSVNAIKIESRQGPFTLANIRNHEDGRPISIARNTWFEICVSSPIYATSPCRQTFYSPKKLVLVTLKVMKPSLVFCLRVLLNCCSVSATAVLVDAAGPEVVYPPMQAPASPSLLNAVEENPTVSPHGDDRHYTNGIKLSYTTGPLSESSIWNAPTRWLGNYTFLFHRQTCETDDRLEWTILGQSIFTPQNHRVSNPSLSDRPYASWLYTGLNFIQDSDAQQLTSLEFLGGIIGPWALGRQVQNNVHALFGEQLVRGWNHQLGNEFGFTASWERKWRFNHELGKGYSWEIIPDAGITVGNVFTFAEAGFLVRWGRGLKACWVLR